MCSSIEDFKIQTKINLAIHLLIHWLRTFAKHKDKNTYNMRTHFCSTVVRTGWNGGFQGL